VSFITIDPNHLAEHRRELAAASLRLANRSQKRGPYLQREKGRQITNVARLLEETSLLKQAVELVVTIQTHPVPLLAQMLIKM